jgi:dienelactone hydrolase
VAVTTAAFLVGALVGTTTPVGPGDTAAALPQTHAVRTWSETWVDASRQACRPTCGPRAMRTHVWAPTDGGGHPVVVFAHGFATEPTAYDRFLRTLATAGYVVVAPELPEATSTGPCCPTRTHTALQAGDVSFALSRVTTLGATPGSAFAGLVTLEGPIVAGHSDGAQVAAAVASSSVGDPRFAGAVVVAGARDPLVSGWGPRLGRVLIVHGDADHVDPIALAQPVYDASAAPKAFLAGAGRSHSGVILDTDAEAGRQAIVGWMDWASRDDVSGLGRFRGWGTSPGWYLRGTAGIGWSPVGELESVTPGPSSVVVSGWALDPETVFGLYVDVWVDAQLTTMAAIGSRPDIDAAWKNGPNHGFNASVAVAPGPHRVCAWAHNVGAGNDVELGCRDVTVAPPPPPAAPAGLAGRGYDRSATLWWAHSPAGEGVIDYEVQCACGVTKTVPSTSTSTSVVGLGNGQPVTLSVRARNASGPGPAAVVVVTPTDRAAGVAPVAPTRVLDTRHDGVPLGPGGSLHLPLSPPAGAIGAVLAVTAVAPSAPTHVTVSPAGEGPGDVSSLNTDPARGPVSNQVVVPLGADGVDLHNNTGTVHLAVDLMGWLVDGDGLTRRPAPPVRVLDTRDGGSPLGPGASIDLPVGHPGAAVALVVTSTAATADSFLTAWGTGARPLASISNPRPGADRAAHVVVPVDVDGTVHLFNNSGSTHVVVDLVGAYETDPDGPRWHPQAPWRLYDSRTAEGPLDPGVARRLPGAGPVQANLTVTGAAAAGFVTVWGDGPWPGTSNVNAGPGATVANQAVPGDESGIQALSNAGAHLIVDVTGAWR